MSATKVALPGGGEATLIHRKKTTARALAVAFLDHGNCWIICGLCGSSRRMEKGENYEDASEWLYKHNRNSEHGRGRIPPHSLDELLSQKVLAELLANAAGATSMRDVFTKQRSRLLSKAQLSTILGDDVLANMTLTGNVKVSRCCLSRESRCCVGLTVGSISVLIP